MKKTTVLGIFTLGFLLIFVSCSRDYPLHEKGGDIRFPLSVGNWWQYEHVWTIEGIDFPWIEDTLRFFTRWEIIKRETIEGVPHITYLLECEENREGESVRTSLEWYTEKWEGERGLFNIAYSIGGGGLPAKKFYPYKIKFRDKLFNSPEEVFDYVRGTIYAKGDTIIRIPPRKVLVYPLYVGKDWVSFKDVWLQKRKVVDMEIVTTPCGDFLCYKIEVYGDMFGEDKDAVWYDWFSNEGLIKRYIWFRGEAVNPDGTIIGTFESMQTQILENFFAKY